MDPRRSGVIQFRRPISSCGPHGLFETFRRQLLVSVSRDYFDLLESRAGYRFLAHARTLGGDVGVEILELAAVADAFGRQRHEGIGLAIEPSQQQIRHRLHGELPAAIARRQREAFLRVIDLFERRAMRPRHELGGCADRREQPGNA